eukprot:4287999-Amphidinium_carterae.1
MEGVQRAMIAMSSGRIRRVAFEMLVRFFSSDFATEIGCTSGRDEPRDVSEDSEVVSSEFDLLLCSLSELLLTDLSFCEPPKRFVLLVLDPSDCLHQETLSYLKRLYSGVLELESLAARTSDRALSKWIRDLVWPESSWTREVLETLRADSWVLRREYLRASLVDYARGWRSTLICENGNRLGRRKEVGATGKSSVLRLWHHLQNESGISEQYGRTSLNVESLQNKSELTDEFFRPDKGHSSLSDETVDQLIAPAAGFPTHNPGEYKMASLHGLCVHHHEGSWASLQDCWWTRLLTPGCIVSTDEVSRQKVHLVVKSSPHGALVIDGELDRVQQKLGAFNFTVHCPVKTSVFTVRDPRKTKVVQTKLTAPGCAEHLELKEPVRSIVLTSASKKGTPLLQWSAMNGFKPLTVPQLREFLRRLTLIEGSSSSHLGSDTMLSEEECVRRLAKLIHHSDDEKHVNDILAARCVDVADTVLEKTPVDIAEDLANESSEEDSDCAEHPDVDDLAASIAAARSRQKRYRALTESIVKKRKKPSTPVSDATLKASASAVEIPFRVDKPLSLTEARKYLPPDCTLLHEHSSKYYRRWKCVSPHQTQMFTKLYGGQREALQSDEALKYVLVQAWTAYCSKHRCACPYKLDLPF